MNKLYTKKHNIKSDIKFNMKFTLLKFMVYIMGIVLFIGFIFIISILCKYIYYIN